MKTLRTNSQIAAVLFLVALLLGGCFSNKPKITGLEKSIEPYALYYPIRENWGPGFVFSGDIVDGKIQNVEEICSNLYGDEQISDSSSIFLANYSGKDEKSLDIGVQLLKRVAGEKNAATLNLADIKSVDDVDISWGDLRETSYARAEQWLKKGEPRPVEGRCESAIDDLKAKGKFIGRVFIITRALSAGSVSYEFNHLRRAGGEAKVKVHEVVEAQVAATWKVTGDTSLSINKQVYIGYAKPALLEEWVPTGLVSPGIVSVKAREINAVISE